MLKLITDGFTLAAILAGLWAAWLWWRSGQVGVQLREYPKLDGTRESIKALLEAMSDKDDAKAFHDAVNLGATLNSHAALWTAASVAAQAVATILGWIASG